MAQQLEDELIIRYLLGEASEQEAEQLEERYFSDDDYFEQLQAVEEDLIDAYAGGELSAVERKRFEHHFLASPQRRQRVAFAQALLSSAARKRESASAAAYTGERKSWWPAWPGFLRIPQPVMQMLFVTGLAVLALAGSWSVLQSRRLRDQLARITAEQTELRSEGQSLRQEIERQNQALAQERTARDRLEETVRARQLRSIASFILMPGGVRSQEDGRPLVIRPGTDVVELQLDLESEEDVQYRVAVRTAEDQEIWSQDGLQPRRTPTGRAVTLSLPANLLPPGDYVVMLRMVTKSGNLENAGQYPFRTIRR